MSPWLTYARLAEIDANPGACSPEEVAILAFGYRRWRHLLEWVDKQEAGAMERLKDHIFASGVPKDPRYPVADAIVAYLKDHDPRKLGFEEEPKD
jgi:hypothetical protein